MKIIIPLVGTFGKEGGWRVLSQLSDHWIKDGHEVVFYSHRKSTGPYYPTKAQIVYYTNSGDVSDTCDPTSAKALLGPLQLQRIVRKILDGQKADVVLATHSFTADPVSKSTIQAKKFYYVQAYEPDYYYQNSIKTRVYKKWSKRSYTLDLSIIVNAPMYLDYHEIRSDMFVYPGLALDVFKPITTGKLTEKIILGTIGRTEKYKGTSYVLEAFRTLRKTLGDKVELHIAFGEESMAEEDGVTVLRPDGDQQLAQYYNSLDVYICAGLIQLEAVHYPVIEAMACGTPVITTGYLPATVENSWKIEVKNADQIVTNVYRILDNEEERETKIAKGRDAVQKFDWNVVSEKMLNYFRIKQN